MHNKIDNIHKNIENIKKIILNKCQVSEKIFIVEFVSYYFIVDKKRPDEMVLQIRDKPKTIFFKSKIFEELNKRNNNLSKEELRFYLDHLESEGWITRKSLELIEWADKSELSFEENKKIFKSLFFLLKKKKIYIEYKVNVKAFLSSSQPTIFYAMEFPEPEEEANDEKYQFYKELRKEVEEQLKLNLVMLYEDKSTGNLATRIKNEIRNCSFFIADLTSKDNFNPNVFYEIGIAEGFNKKPLLILKEDKWDIIKEKKLPFDISNHNVMSYSLENSKKCIEEIINTIKSELNK